MRSFTIVRELRQGLYQFDHHGQHGVELGEDLIDLVHLRRRMGDIVHHSGGAAYTDRSGESQ